MFDNLHGSVKKTTLDRVMDKLVDEGKLQAKAYGKSKIYYPPQVRVQKVGGSFGASAALTRHCGAAMCRINTRRCLRSSWRRWMSVASRSETRSRHSPRK